MAITHERIAGAFRRRRSGRCERAESALWSWADAFERRGTDPRRRGGRVRFGRAKVSIDKRSAVRVLAIPFALLPSSSAVEQVTVNSNKLLFRSLRKLSHLR